MPVSRATAFGPSAHVESRPLKLTTSVALPAALGLFLAICSFVGLSRIAHPEAPRALAALMGATCWIYVYAASQLRLAPAVMVLSAAGVIFAGAIEAPEHPQLLSAICFGHAITCFYLARQFSASRVGSRIWLTLGVFYMSIGILPWLSTLAFR